jgi:hypothetical protein
MADQRLIYSSENGDQWFLIYEFGAAQAFVRHQANPSSGGQVTDTPMDEFLAQDRSGPEHLALRRILDELDPSTRSVR